MAIQLLDSDECKRVSGGAGSLIETILDESIKVAGDVLATSGLGKLIPLGLRVIGSVVDSNLVKKAFTFLHL
jgi:hypothetical protein